MPPQSLYRPNRKMCPFAKSNRPGKVCALGSRGWSTSNVSATHAVAIFGVNNFRRAVKTYVNSWSTDRQEQWVFRRPVSNCLTLHYTFRSDPQAGGQFAHSLYSQLPSTSRSYPQPEDALNNSSWEANSCSPTQIPTMNMKSSSLIVSNPPILFIEYSSTSRSP